jgi:serine phosphatase RsbU (regulator of sigma subunit)
MSLQPDGLKLLAEIAGKLDQALVAAARGRPPGEGGPTGDGATGAPAAVGTDPEVLRCIVGIASATEAPQAIDFILDAAVAATQADRAFLMLLEEGRKLRYKGGRAIDQETVAAEGALHSKTVIRKVITTGESVRVEDTARELDASESLAGMGPRSVVCVPVRRSDGKGGHAIGGVLYLDCRAPIHTFSLADQEAALTIADAGGIAFDRIEKGGPLPTSAKGGGGSAAEIQKLKDNITRLLDVGRAIGTTLVLDDLLVLALEKVLEVTKADRGFIMLLEDQKPVFKIGRAWNKKEGPEKKTMRLDETQFFFSKTIVKRALGEGRSICIKDTVGGPGEDMSVSIVEMELQSVMATPLREKNETLGLIYVDSKASNREFNESDLELFEALAAQAAIALQNAILYAQVKEKSRLESEIQIAAQMQQDMCPRKVPVLPGIDVSGRMIPAKEVGGDYYDFVEDPHSPGKSLSLIVGDVSGKGLGSGIVAVMARCFLRSMITAYGVESPQALLSYLNAILSADLKPGMFMTMLMVVWDSQRKTVRYASAGHEHLVVYRAKTRKAETIKSGGVALGLSATTGPTPDTELRLGSGDALVLYSDGVTEAMNAESDEFTLERLVEVVQRHGPSAIAAAHLVSAIADEVTEHVKGADQSDDITLVVLRKT